MIKRFLIIVIGMTLFFLHFLFTSTITSEAAGQMIRVGVDTANIRSEPSNEARIIAQAHRGDQFEVQQEKFGWQEIQLSNDRKGWIAGHIVIEDHNENNEDSEDNTSKKHSENNSSQKQGNVLVDHLHVRNLPSLSADIMGKLHTGDQVSITGQRNDWTNILFREESAWISSEYIQLSGESSIEKNESPGGFAYISTEGTHLRATPDLSSAIIAKGSKGERYPILDQVDNWYKIALASGNEAYVASWVVSTSQRQPTSSETTPSKKVSNTSSGLKNKTIVLDAGHGGYDPGAVSDTDQFEKELTLQTAKRLEEKLTAAGANVVLTRSDDRHVSLSSRMSIANGGDHDAFISIHYDSSHHSEAEGFTTFYHHEHQFDLANEINQALEASISLRNRGTQEGNYYVIRENSLPAILIELGFLSNSEERDHIVTDSYQERAVDSIYKGLQSYFK